MEERCLQHPTKPADSIQLHGHKFLMHKLKFHSDGDPHGTVGVRVGSGGSYHRMLFLWSLAMPIPDLNLLGAIEGFLQTQQNSRF